MQPKRLLFFVSIIALTMQACSVPASSSADPVQAPTVDPPFEAGLLDATGSELNNNPTETDINCEDAETNYDPAGFSQTGGRFIVLDDPVMIAAAQATWLDSDELVLGVEQNGAAQAFPVFQMVYHHIANTTVGGEPYLVTY